MKEGETERRLAVQQRLRDLQVETRGQERQMLHLLAAAQTFAGEFKDLGFY